MRSCALDYSIVQTPGSVLSVVIPTYNRQREIRQTLELFLSQRQAAGLQTEVDIIVCDNASTDDSEPYLKSLAERGYITYYRHTENIGPMPQLYVGPARAKAPYCWFFGDDDWPKPGALAHVVNLLKEDTYDFISLNYEMRDHKMKKTLEDSVNIKKSRKFKTFCNFSEHFTVYQSGFISCQIFRTALFTAIDPTPYLEPAYGFQHFGAYLQAFHDKPTYYEGTPQVIYRSGNFEDEDAIFKRNATHLSFPIMRAIEIARERSHIPADIWERLSGVTYTRDYKRTNRAKLSDLILENVFRCVAANYAPTEADWQDIETVSQHWRPKAKLALSAAKDLFEKIDILIEKKEQDISQTIAKLEQLSGPDAALLLKNGKEALISRALGYDTQRHELQRFALMAAKQIASSKLDDMIQDPQNTEPVQSHIRKTA